MATGKMSSTTGKIVGGTLFVACVAGVFFINWPKKAQEEVALIRPLKSLVVGEDTEIAGGQYPGKVQATKRVELSFEVPGRLSELPIVKGQEVEQGAILAKLDPQDYQSDLDAATARFDQAKAYLERIRKAVAANAVSKQELDDAAASAQVAESQVAIKRKALADTTLSAVFKGVVADLYVDNFQDVQAKQAVLSLQDVTALELQVSVPEQRLASVRPEDKGKPQYRFVARFDYFPGVDFDVTFKEISTQADPITQTYSATFLLTVPADKSVLPGMTATLHEYRLPVANGAEALMVPLKLVPRDPKGGYFVWLVKPTAESGVETVQRQAVTVGAMRDDLIEVRTGLKRGDRIAAAGVSLLRDGEKIRLITASSQGE